jgi:hypothetical protein
VQHDGTVLTGSRDATVLAWREGAAVKSYANHADWVTCLAAVPGWPHFLSASADHTLALQREDEVFTNKKHSGVIKGLVLNSSATAVTAGMDGNIIASDLERELEVTVSIQWRRSLTALARGTGENGIMYTGSVTGSLYSVDLRAAASSARTVTDTVPGAHSDAVRALVMMSHSTLVSAGSDGVVKVWDTRQLSAPSTTFKVHTDSVWALCPIAGTSTFLSGGRDGTVVGTNIRTLQTSVLVESSFPIVSLTVCNHGQSLLVCTTSTSVDSYDLPSLVHEDLRTARRSVTASGTVRASFAGLGNINDTEVSFLSPSRVVLDVREPAPVHELIEADLGVYESPELIPVNFPNNEAKRNWCSATPSKWRREPQPKPDAVLPGGHGFIKCQLLHSRRHVAALSTNGKAYIFDICRLVVVYTETAPTTTGGVPDWDAVVKRLNQRHPAHASSWCTAVCRWGAVCITLSAEDCMNCFMTEWEFHMFAKRVLPREAASVQATVRLPSICALSRTKRDRWKGISPYNLGVELLRGLFRSDRTARTLPRIVVWSTPNHQIASDCSAGVVLNPFDCAEASYHADDVRIPSWVHSLVASPPTGPPPSQVVAVKVVADNPKCSKLPQVTQKELQFGRYAPLADVAVTIAKQLKLPLDSLPQTSDVNAMLRSAGRPPLIGDDNSRDDQSRLTFDEYIEFLTAAGDVVLDPLMTVWAAYLAYKERGAPFLTLRYRVFNPGPSPVETIGD